MIVNVTERNIWVINQAWRVKPGWILTKMFFLRVCGLRRSRGPQAWSIKDLVYGIRGNFSRRTQQVVQSKHSLRSNRFLSFSRRRSNKQAKKRTSEGARLGWAKIGVKWGGGVSFPSRKFLETPARAVKIAPSCPFG